MKRLVSALLALLILLGVFSTVGAEGPVVKFDKKVIVSFQGREVAVSFYLQNPKRYKEAMNAQLVDEEGTVVAETTLSSSRSKRRLVFTVPDTWIGEKRLSVLVNGETATEQELSLAVDDIRNKAVKTVNTSYNKMSITFDAAYGEKNMTRVLDVLDKYGVKATFFVTGGWANTYQDWLKEIARRGHELANHTWDHPRLNSQPHDKVFRQIQRTNNIIKELTGQTPSAFRPPYGEMNHNVRCLARSQVLETFIWTYDSRDWDNKYTLSRIMNRITKDIKAGDIILFHQDGKLTPEVIDQVIPYYQSLGLELVTLSELMDEGPYTVGEDGVVRFQKETEQ